MAAVQKYKPANERHAIEEVVFTFNLPPNEKIKNPAKFGLLLEKEFKKDFRKFSEVQTAVGHLQLKETETSFSDASVKCTGFLFERYHEDGSLKWRLRGNNGEGQSSISINLLEYDAWDKEKKRVIGWLKKISAFDPTLRFSGINLMYIDRFYWTSKEDPQPTSILNSKSKHFPPVIFEEGIFPAMSMVRFNKKNEDWIKDASINMQMQKSTSGGSRLEISMPIGLAFEKPVKAKTFFSKTGEGGANFFLDYLHSVNKEYLKDMLISYL